MRSLLLLALLLAPAASAPAQLISRGSAGVRDVALTFDAGADRGYAASILATLERDHIRATFGMTGLWAQQNASLVRRMARDGDQFINHTYDHRSFTGFSTRTYPLTWQQRSWEITQADLIIRKLTGRSSQPYFRPPFGDYDAATLTLVHQLGYRYVIMWTVDSLGWAHLGAPQILERCLAQLSPGTILLMHVGSQSQDALALQPFIAAAQRRGYRFVTIGQLLSVRG